MLLLSTADFRLAVSGRWWLPWRLGRAAAELWHAARLPGTLWLQRVLRPAGGARTGVRCVWTGAAHRVPDAWSVRPRLCRRRRCSCSCTGRPKLRSEDDNSCSVVFKKRQWNNENLQQLLLPPFYSVGCGMFLCPVFVWCRCKLDIIIAQRCCCQMCFLDAPSWLLHPSNGGANKSSAVAEMGVRLATVDMGRGGCCAPFCGENLVPI